MNSTGQNIRSILCIRDCAHGDVLLTTPAVKALRDKFPNAEIVYLTKRCDGDVLAGFPGIDSIVTFEDVKRGRKGPREFDLIIDFRDHDGPIPFRCNGQIVKAIDNAIMRSETGHRIARMKRARPFAFQYADIAGVTFPDGARPIIRVDDASKLLRDYGVKDDEPFVVVSFDSWWKSKAYPDNKALDLCKMLAKDIKVVITGKIGRYTNFRGENIINLCNKTTVQQLAYIIKQSRLFIGIDSMPIHIADAMGTKSISIWTSTEPKSILTNGSENVSIQSDMECHPCFRTECNRPGGKYCFPSPERIYEEAVKMLKNETRPVTWIAMPTMGQVDLTTQAIKGLFEKKNDFPFHLILIDNGSNPEDAQALRDLNTKYNFTLIRNETNLGFVAATNAGIEYALKNSKRIEFDYALWLNNDVTIDADGWLEHLVHASNGKAVVGPEGSRLKQDFSHAGWMKPGQEPHYVDGWCLFAPLRYYQPSLVGMLDTNINIFSEDADWCIRAKQRGHEIKLINVPITHLKHKAYKLFPARDRCQESLKYMQMKYGTLSDALKPIKQEETLPEPVNVVQSRIKQTCVICGTNTDSVTLGTVQGYKIVRCSRCGLQRVDEIESPEALAAHYDKSLQLRMTPQWMKNVQRTQEGYWIEMDKYDINTMKRHGRFLDVGCNLGVMVERAKRFGWDAIGSDFAPAFVEKCRERGLNVILGSGLNGQVSGPLQVITMFDVIEHDPNPAATLKRAFELLDTRGFMALTTPDHGCAHARRLGLKWEHIRPIEHIWHFTTSTITRLLEECGWIVDEVRNADCHVDYVGNRMFFCRKG